MALEQRLQMKLATKLVMTPSLQQAIKLLQLNKLELIDELNQEVLENPVLEDLSVEDPHFTASTVDSSEGNKTLEQLESGNDGKLDDNSDMNNGKDDKLTEAEWEQLLLDNREFRNYSYEKKEMIALENIIRARASTLSEHLTWQLDMKRLTPDDHDIASEIIGNINDDGYLTVSTEEIADQIGCEPESVENILKIVQQFDPIGVGARDPRECLLIQIRESELKGALVEKIVMYYLPLVERNGYAEIAKRLDATLEEVQEAVSQLRRFEPKPGRSFSSQPSSYIIPDVFIEKVGNEYVITLNDQGIPRLRISNNYKTFLSYGKDASNKARQYVEQKYKSAMWLLRSIEQRRQTILKVSASILKLQYEFFEKGLAYLKPMVLRDVAEDIEMHESTVSRVSTNKYMQTPQGIFEIKYFFHSGLTSSSGDDISSLRVKEMIKDIVAHEDSKKPLSDQKIATMLKKRGINIARRTVAKYREELKILPSNRRRVY